MAHSQGRLNAEHAVMMGHVASIHRTALGGGAETSRPAPAGGGTPVAEKYGSFAKAAARHPMTTCCQS